MLAGHLSGSLSKDAFHSIMMSFVRGDLGQLGRNNLTAGKHALQSGARSERLQKRNRGD